DPCVSSRRVVFDDVVITVLTSHASRWTFQSAAELVVREVVVNDNGGTRSCADFPFHLNGSNGTPAEADCETSITVAAGAYSITQLAVVGYTTTLSNCSGITLATLASAICTITNDDQAPDFAFGGFYAPVDNLPVFNLVKAGQAIPLR